MNKRIMDSNALQAEFDLAIEHLADDFAHIQTGRATTELVEEIKVDAYGTQSPMQNVANISVADSKTINIQPWDKSIIEEIGKAISAANLGLAVIVEGDMVRVKVPDLTEERRKDYVKIMKERSESTRQQVRAIRQTYMKDVDGKVKGGELPEDDGKRFKDEVEKKVKETNEKIEEMKDAKEKTLMSV